MAENSKIEWTDHTWNPWIGCTKVSPGCANCYAWYLMAVRYGRVEWGAGKPRIRTSAANWQEPLRWNKAEEGKMVSHAEFVANRRPRVFCASLADWLDEEVPVAWLADMLDLIRRTPNLDWLLLTKRPQNWRPRIEKALRYAMMESPIMDDNEREAARLARHPFACWLQEWVMHRQSPANVWVGTTVEDQQRADERIAELLCIPAKVRFLSCEPMLGPIDLFAAKGDPKNTGFALTDGFGRVDGEGLGIHWVICGGESGPGARPMHPDWARSLRDQCAAVGVPFFFKQWGEWTICHPDARDGAATVSMFPDGRTLTMDEWFGYCAQHGGGARLLEWRACAMVREGKKAAGRLLDGLEHSAFPEVRA